MLIIFISVALLISGIILSFKDMYDDFIILRFILVFIGTIASFVTISQAIINHTGVSVQIENETLERNRIIDTYNRTMNTNDISIVDKREVIKDIYDWNKQCNSVKYWSNNIWTNWIYNKEIVDTCAIPITEEDLNQ